MGKKSRIKNREERRNALPSFQVEFKARPFEGLDIEAQIVALRELIPAGYLTIKTTKAFGQYQVMLVSLLPQMSRAMVREDGRKMVAMQFGGASANLSHDVAAALRDVCVAEQPGEVTVTTAQPAPDLSDMIDSVTTPLTVTEDFSFWFTDEQLKQTEIQEMVKQSKEELFLTKPVVGVNNAFWVSMNQPFVRWVRTEDMEAVYDGLARIQSRGELPVEQAKFAGVFRACGLLIPVWQLPQDCDAEKLANNLQLFNETFEKAIANTNPLSARERGSRSGVINRQVVLK